MRRMEDGDVAHTCSIMSGGVRAGFDFKKHATNKHDVRVVSVICAVFMLVHVTIGVVHSSFWLRRGTNRTHAIIQHTSKQTRYQEQSGVKGFHVEFV